jgi:hypothetical protein
VGSNPTPSAICRRQSRRKAWFFGLARLSTPKSTPKGASGTPPLALGPSRTRAGVLWRRRDAPATHHKHGQLAVPLRSGFHHHHRTPRQMRGRVAGPAAPAGGVHRLAPPPAAAPAEPAAAATPGARRRQAGRVRPCRRTLQPSGQEARQRRPVVRLRPRPPIRAARLGALCRCYLSPLSIQVLARICEQRQRGRRPEPRNQRREALRFWLPPLIPTGDNRGQPGTPGTP